MARTKQLQVKVWSFYLAGLALAFFSTTFSSSEALRFFESIFSIGLDLVCGVVCQLELNYIYVFKQSAMIT